MIVRIVAVVFCGVVVAECELLCGRPHGVGDAVIDDIHILLGGIMVCFKPGIPEIQI